MMNAGKQHVQEKHYMKNKRMKVLYFALRPTEIVNRTLHSYQHAHNLFLKKICKICSFLQPYIPYETARSMLKTFCLLHLPVICMEKNDITVALVMWALAQLVFG